MELTTQRRAKRSAATEPAAAAVTAVPDAPPPPHKSQMCKSASRNSLLSCSWSYIIFEIASFG